MADNKLRLRITGPDGKGRTVELTGTSFIVGRGEEAALKLDDPKVSDLAARLKVKDGEVTVTDLGGDEPATIDGEKVGKELVLQPGQTLKVGGTQISIAEEKSKFEKGGKAKGGKPFNDAATVIQDNPTTEGNAARALRPEPAERLAAAAHKVPDHKHQAHHSIDDLATRKEVARLPADYAARFLSLELPEAFKPTKEARRLQVALVWGDDQFLEVKDIRPGELVTAGSATSTSFRVYHDAFKASSPVIQPSGGEFRVLLPAGAPSKVTSDGKTISGDQLASSGKGNAIDVPFKGVSYEIGLNDRVQIELGNLQIIARYTRPQPIKSRPASERMDVNFLSTLIILLLCGIAFERMIAITDFANVNLSDDLFKNKDRFAKYIAKSEQKEKPKFEKLSGVKEGAKAKDDEGKFGKKEADKKEAAPSKKGAPVVDVNKREEDRKKVMNSGLLALLGDSAGATSNVFGPGGLGSGLNNAMGGINGAAGMGDAAGVGGLGSRGGGSGGGGTALGIGGLGGHGSGRGRGGSGEFDLGGTGKAATQFVPGKTNVIGGLTADEVGRIIRRHWNEIKYCYEKELNKDPNLYGKVAVYFEIGPVGDVTVAQVRETTMNNTDVESCMVDKVKLWKFPAPRGGGVVQVNYPFIFKQG